ncbi:MAG: tetratricopeptide repeat protein [Phycisphaerales bacterium]|nr:MAG: tetratricopeptide repeat protein [Phycisphaerales bacterium]
MSREGTSTGPNQRTGRSGTHIPVAFLLIAVGLLVVTIAVWSGVMDAPFHFDDQRTVEFNEEIRHLGNIPLFTRGLLHRGALKIGYALNYAAGEKEADGTPRAESFHLVNIILHAVNALLAFVLASLILGRSRANDVRAGRLPLAAAVALLFAVHPMHGMAVGLVASRAVVQAATFSLLSLVLLAKALVAGVSKAGKCALLAGAVVCFIIALGSKSVAVSTLGLAPLVAWMLSPDRPSPRARRLFAGAVVLALAGAGVIALAFGREVWQTSAHGPGVNLLTQAGVITRYLGLMFWPSALSVEHDVSLVSAVWSIRVLLPVVLMIALAAIGVVLLARRRLLGLCIGWFFVSLAPSSSIVPRAELMVEYRTYLAVLGFAGAAVWLLSRLAAVITDLVRGGVKVRFALSIALNVGVLAALSARTIARHEVYADPVALWADAAAKAPNRARPAFNLGTCLVRSGRYAEGLPYLQRTEEMQPQRAEVHVILAKAYTALDRLDEAAGELKRAEALMVEAPPDDPELGTSIIAGLAQEFWTLGNRYASRGQHAQAADSYGRTVVHDPDRAEAYYNLGVVLLMDRDYHGAVAAWRQGLRRHADDFEMAVELAWQLAASPDPAVRDGPAATRLAEHLVDTSQTPSAELLDLLAAAQAQAGRFDEAVANATEALRLARARGDEQLVERIRSRLETYETGRALGQGQ